MRSNSLLNFDTFIQINPIAITNLLFLFSLHFLKTEKQTFEQTAKKSNVNTIRVAVRILSRGVHSVGSSFSMIGASDGRIMTPLELINKIFSAILKCDINPMRNASFFNLSR